MLPKKSRTNLIEFGKNLKKIRTKKDLSLRQLAAACNVDYSDIAKLEKGGGNPTLLTLFDLAAGLEVHPKKLLDFEIDLD